MNAINLPATWTSAAAQQAAVATPSAAPPRKEESDIYSPGIGARATIWLAPPAAALAGYAIGVGSGLGSVIVGGAVGLVGGAVGGFVIGGIADLARFMSTDKQYRYKGAALGALVGAVGGAVLAHLLPPFAGGLGLGAVGLGAGFVASKITSSSVEKKRERAVADALHNGQVSVMPFLEKISSKNAGKGSELLESFRVLEEKGWRFGDVRGAFEYGLTSASYGYEAEVRSPGGQSDRVPIAGVPALRYFSGNGDLPVGEDKQLADAISGLLSQGKIFGTGWEAPASVPADPESRAMFAASVFGAIRNGQRLSASQDGLQFKIDAHNLAELEAGVKSMDDTAARYNAVFGAALKAGDLDLDRRQAIMEAAVSSPLGASLDRAGKLILDLNACWITPGENVADRTTRTLRVFDELGRGEQGAVDLEHAVALAVGMSGRLGPDESVKAIRHLRDTQPNVDASIADRYQKDFLRLVKATGDVATAVSAAHVAHTVSAGVAEPHIALIESLTAAAPAGYGDVVMDYATLMASRDAAEPLEVSGERYCRLMRGLGASAEEAAPTYAFLRTGTASGQISGTMDEALQRFLHRVKAGDTPRAARQSLVGSSGAPGSALIEIPRDDLRRYLGDDAGRAADHLTDRLALLGDDDRKRFADGFLRLAGATEDLQTTVRASDLLLALPADVGEQHLHILEELARAKPARGTLLLNYATLMAARDPALPMEESVKAYALLLTGLNDMKQSQEAAPTFLFLREAQSRGKFAGKKLDDLANEFLVAMFTAQDAHRARQYVLAQDSAGTPNGGVQKTEGEVKIGGVAIPIRRKTEEPSGS